MNFKSVPVIRGRQAIAGLLKLIDGLGYVAGGYARYCVSNSDKLAKPNDVDVFSTSEENFHKIVSALEQNEFICIKDTALAVTYDATEKWTRCPLIQVIKPFRQGATGTLQNILEHFDFTVTMAGLIDSRTALIHEDFEEHERRKRLVITNVVCPVTSVLRCSKYVAKGYILDLKEIAKLFVNWDTRDEKFKADVYKLANFDLKNLTDEQRAEMTQIYTAMFVD